MILGKKRKVVIIVQARMSSTRLPGKVLMPLLGRPMLEFQLERLRNVQNASQIVVATTTQNTDDPIAALCNRLGVEVFRGDESDVLHRYYSAAKHCGADVIVRITGDCPLIDPLIIERVIDFFLDSPYDYVGNTLQKTYPRGMDTEVFSFESLEHAQKDAQEPAEREHVTLYIYRHPELFSLANIAHSSDQSHYRLTVDTPEDFFLITKIVEALHPKDPEIPLHKIVKFLEENPALAKINSHIIQKTS